MDSNINTSNGNEKHLAHRWFSPHGKKLAVFLVIILVVFLFGVMVGKKVAYFGQRLSKSMMVKGLPEKNVLYMHEGMMGGELSFYGNQKKAGVINRISGVVTAVDTNKISLNDNGGALQDVYSSADTVITSSSGFIHISSLKTGQFIVVSYELKDGKKSAVHIQVQ
jgi:hypothetical protein